MLLKSRSADVSALPTYSHAYPDPRFLSARTHHRYLAKLAASVGLLLVLALSFLSLIQLSFVPSDGTLNYVIIIDSGSTSTRLHVYQWLPAAAHSPLPVLHALKGGSAGYAAAAAAAATHGVPGLVASSYDRVETEPGLDSFGKEVAVEAAREGVEGALAPLLHWAAAEIPAAHHSETPVFLLATAGVRKLEQEQRGMLFGAVRATLGNSGFKFRPEWARVISGKDEGVYGWIALNYATGALDNATEAAQANKARGEELSEQPGAPLPGHQLFTVGALDLGGSSLEVAFVPGTAAAAGGEMVSVAGIPYNLYIHSHHHYGLNDAFDRSIAHLLEQERRRQEWRRRHDPAATAAAAQPRSPMLALPPSPDWPTSPLFKGQKAAAGALLAVQRVDDVAPGGGEAVAQTGEEGANVKAARAAAQRGGGSAGGSAALLRTAGSGSSGKKLNGTKPAGTGVDSRHVGAGVSTAKAADTVGAAAPGRGGRGTAQGGRGAIPGERPPIFPHEEVNTGDSGGGVRAHGHSGGGDADVEAPGSNRAGTVSREKGGGGGAADKGSASKPEAATLPSSSKRGEGAGGGHAAGSRQEGPEAGDRSSGAFAAAAPGAGMTGSGGGRGVGGSGAAPQGAKPGRTHSSQHSVGSTGAAGEADGAAGVTREYAGHGAGIPGRRAGEVVMKASSVGVLAVGDGGDGTPGDRKAVSKGGGNARMRPPSVSGGGSSGGDNASRGGERIGERVGASHSRISAVSGLAGEFAGAGQAQSRGSGTRADWSDGAEGSSRGARAAGTPAAAWAGAASRGGGADSMRVADAVVRGDVLGAGGGQRAPTVATVDGRVQTPRAPIQRRAEEEVDRGRAPAGDADRGLEAETQVHPEVDDEADLEVDDKAGLEAEDEAVLEAEDEAGSEADDEAGLEVDVEAGLELEAVDMHGDGSGGGEQGVRGRQLLTAARPATDGPDGGNPLVRTGISYNKKDLEHPCLQQGYNQTYSGGATSSISGDVLLIGTGDWAACEELAAHVVNATTPCPSAAPCAMGATQPPPRGRLFGLSGFYVVNHFYGLPTTPGASTSFAALAEASRAFCSRHWSEVEAASPNVKHLDKYCFRGPFVLHLLRDGLGVLESQVEVVGKGLSWTLGAALLEGGRLKEELHGMPYSSTEYDSDPGPGALLAALGLTVALLVLLAALVMLPCRWRSGRADAARQRGAGLLPTVLSSGDVTSGARRGSLFESGSSPSKGSGLMTRCVSSLSAVGSRSNRERSATRRTMSRDDLQALVVEV
ncbi:hypothetical protein CYMTET_38520 [Cymbomonas tetramitiformis]|uniref:Apyrase n=1 Tax=Cymbomonas tetramitiformis TaxID=36881 RepID=A0AAE0F4V4_9CHLO|nr:hypothetical protein CYMTET_38520 [Cymbomonas tetramitiformis]